MPISPGAWAFRLAYELSPIVLTGGIAQQMPGGALPILTILQGQSYSGGILSVLGPLDADNYFARFRVLPGGTLGDWQFGTYPFANQAIAANAIIFQPLSVSLLMICPATEATPYSLKNAVMTSLQATLAQHTASGGMFSVATPSYLYTNMLLSGIRDVSNTESEQPQNAYQWDFTQPLLTLQQAQQVQNNLMSKMSAGTQVDAAAWSGVSPTVGNANSLAGSSVVPSGGQTPAGTAAAQTLPTPPIPPSGGSSSVTTLET